jgi:acetyl-CoA carboxylase biotin carboxyl carrier protein
VPLSNEDVQEILQLLDSSPYDELRLETDRFRLTLRREGAGGWTQEMETRSPPHVTAGAEAAAAPGAAAETPSAEQAAADDGSLAIAAPLLGTFYRAPKPGAKPFVEVGSRVDEHTVVCIIETMKLMNSIPAGVCGEITEICVDNAGFVEQGQILMRVKAVNSK